MPVAIRLRSAVHELLDPPEIRRACVNAEISSPAG